MKGKRFKMQLLTENLPWMCFLWKPCKSWESLGLTLDPSNTSWEHMTTPTERSLESLPLFCLLNPWPPKWNSLSEISLLPTIYFQGILGTIPLELSLPLSIEYHNPNWQTNCGGTHQPCFQGHVSHRYKSAPSTARISGSHSYHQGKQ